MEQSHLDSTICGALGGSSSGTYRERGRNDDGDLWVCMLCGFMGCGQLKSNHIREHYDKHLHAYAMNVSTKGVWDFAGMPVLAQY